MSPPKLPEIKSNSDTRALCGLLKREDRNHYHFGFENPVEVARRMAEPELPANWAKRLDPRYNRYYYYNKLTKETTWMKPPKIIENKAKVRSNDPSTGQQSVLKIDDSVDPLGQSWSRVYSKTYNRYYYHNKATGQSSWTHPSTTNKSRPNRAKSAASSDLAERKSNHSASGLSKHDSSDDENEHDSRIGVVSKAIEDDPDEFQRRVMEQFPSLKKAFLDLEEGQRKLQRERAEHEIRVKRELDLVNAKLEELRRATALVRGGKDLEKVETSQTSGEPQEAHDIGIEPRQGLNRQSVRRSRRFTLEQDLKRYSIDLERRSVNVVEKRKSMRAMSGVRPDDLRTVMEEANRLAEERGNTPATAETAAKQIERLSVKVQEGKEREDSGTEITPLDEIKFEMDGVTQGLAYAVKEANAQTEAAQEARAVGDNNDYYTLLGVLENASDAELKKAYRRKLIEWHPDKVKPEKREQAVQMTDIIQNSYKVLSDPWEREIYDWFGFEQYLLHVKVITCFKNYLVAGIELVKHPRKGRPRKRVVWLDRDFTEILTFRSRIMEDQRTGKEKTKGTPIQSITEVTTGRSTEVLKRTGKASHARRYFSLICSDRTLDFECPTEESCTFIATRMKLLIIDLKRDREWMHRHYDELEDAT